MSEAFVYCWKNLTDGRLYIGYHKGRRDDGYVCSSKIFLPEYKLNPSNFERTIIAEGTREEMETLETGILCFVDAKHNSLYYNMHNGNGFYSPKPGLFAKEKNPFYGKSHSAEVRKKLSEMNSGKNHPFYGKKRPEHSAKLKQVMKGKKKTAQHCRNISIALAGKATKLWRYEMMKDGSSFEITNLKRWCRDMQLPYIKIYHGREINGYRLVKRLHTKQIAEN